MACATRTILLVPTTTLRGAKAVSCRVFMVKFWVAVLASKAKTAQHGLRYSNNSPGANNDAARCQGGQLSSLHGENLGGGFGLESENCPAWPALLEQFSWCQQRRCAVPRRSAVESSW